MQEALQAAQSLAADRGHAEFDNEHFLLALLDQPEGLAQPLFEKMGVKVDALRTYLQTALQKRAQVHGLTSQTNMAAELQAILRAAEKEMGKLKDEYVVYTKLEATTGAAAATLLAGVVDLVIGDDGQPERGKPSVTSNFNYGADLNAKRAVRQMHESKVKGPERTVNATIANLIKLGFTKEQAEAMVKSAPAVSGQ